MIAKGKSDIRLEFITMRLNCLLIWCSRERTLLPWHTRVPLRHCQGAVWL